MPREIWLVFRRHMAVSLRNPAWVIVGLTQPILYLVLFGPLMERIVSSTPGFPQGDAWQILTPGLLVQLSLFGSLFAGFSLLADLTTGVLERLRVTPARRLSLLLGRVLHDTVQLLVQAVILILLAVVIFGLRAPLAGIALCLTMVALIGITLSAASYALALTLRSEETFPAVLTSISTPVLLLTGILVPITTNLAPHWLYTLSRLNPFAHVMEAQRATFRGEYTVDALLTGSVVLVAITALTIWWATTTFHRENA
ncbi:multidrug ABC transporter permease [Actinophytocola xinjiangensis]|uniref:Transport permease protein n=1 Tax=Actinophytocola xinjiangensis TaxID=485602 RepID=A0A7Z1AYV6_9PSEU|nr:ABC transporter permease [Actinophytocola xinjiangensis]OLF11090.1 multidrug ABC transporter permease [Actinophytocola xinjiangensis]